MRAREMENVGAPTFHVEHWEGVPPCFCVSAGKEGLRGRWSGCVGNRGVMGEEKG